MKIAPKVEKRSQLFFNKYKYASLFKIMGVHLLDNPLISVADLPILTQTYQKLLKTQASQKYLIFGHKAQIVKNDEISLVLTDIFKLVKNQQGIKVSYRNNSMSIYSNDLALVQEVVKLVDLESMTIREAQIAYEPNEIILKNSKYKFRIYVNVKPVKTAVLNNVKQFLTTYKEHIHISEQLQYWAFAARRLYAAKAFFDSNEDMSLIFKLFAPELKIQVLSILNDK